MNRRRRRPREPRPENRPRSEWGPEATLVDAIPQRADDPELWTVYDALLVGEVRIHLAAVTRDTFDQIYDGQRTGRWDIDQLNKTEKTHVGTLLQINLQKEMDLSDGDELDYTIAGVEVDCKWSQSLYGWEIPQEMYLRGPRIALLTWGSDYTFRWAAGLLRIDDTVLRPMGGQRDRKRRISEVGKRKILWLGQGDLVHNTLIGLPGEQRRRILRSDSGQECVNALFRELTGKLVNRATVLTVAQQDDSMKRVRDARKHLKNEGIIVFGHYKPHPELAHTLGLPRPTLGRFVSARLALCSPGESCPAVELQGRRWRLARSGDPVTPAPALPAQGKYAE